MIYSRQIFQKLELELNTKEATVITGMRRVGKTTALTRLFKLTESENKAILDLENPIHRKVFEEENYDNIWNNLRQYGVSNNTKAYLFLDEAQNLPEISRAVKYLYDHWDVKFFLTGSFESLFISSLEPTLEIKRRIKSLNFDISLKSAKFFASFSKYEVKISDSSTRFLSGSFSNTTEGKPPNSINSL